MSREQIAQASRPALARLHATPRWVVPILTLALVAVGALAPVPYALPALMVVFGFIAWIGYLSWPVVNRSGRTLRVIMAALVAGLAVSRVVG